MFSKTKYPYLRTTIVDKLAENKEDKRDNIYDALGGKTSALTSLGKAIADEMDGIQLMKELDHVNNSAEKFIQDNIVPIFQRIGDQDKGELMGYNQAFADLVTAYNALDDEHTKRANTALFGSATATSDKVDLYQTDLHMDVPDAEKVFLFKCNGKCYGYWPDADKLKVTCPSCGVDYYTCDTRESYYHSKPAGSDKYNCESELSVSLNKEMFYFDEELVVTLKMKDIQSAYLQFDGQSEPKVSSSSPFHMARSEGYPGVSKMNIGQVEITTGFSDLNFKGSSTWYGNINITVFYTTRRGQNVQTSVSKYIGVEKVGYFENSTMFIAYGTYKAKVVEKGSIKKVEWSIKEPGKGWKTVKTDNVNGGKTSEWSYTFGSQTGTYEVRAEVHFETNATTYTSGFYVF